TSPCPTSWTRASSPWCRSRPRSAYRASRRASSCRARRSRAPPSRRSACLPGRELPFHSFPHLPRDLHHALELAPLLVLAELVAVVGAGKTALRRKAQVFERHELRRRVDLPFQDILVFQDAGFRRHQAEHHLLASRHEAQRLEAAGALAVELHEEA